MKESKKSMCASLVNVILYSGSTVPVYVVHLKCAKNTNYRLIGLLELVPLAHGGESM